MSEQDTPSATLPAGSPTPYRTALADLESYHQEVEQRIRELAPRLIAGLRAAAVATVRVKYDGCGDSGCIESTTFINEAGEETATADLGMSDEAFEQFFYDLLEVRHGGWEINEGSYGHFEWDVAADLLTHHHSTRFVDSELTKHRGLA